MKKSLYLLLIAVTVLAACNAGPKPVPVDGLETYNDGITKFSIQYPKNWQVNKTEGKRLYVVSDNQSLKRFSFTGDYSKGFPGAKVEFMVMQRDTAVSLDSIAHVNMMFDKTTYQEESATVDGMPAKKYVYAFDLDGGHFMGEMYVASKDTGVYSIISFEAFDGSFDTYKPTFDQIISSAKLAVKPAEMPKKDSTVLVEAPPPSDTLKATGGEGFSIEVPQNFHLENLAKPSNVIKSYSYLGQRRGDSYIRVDIIDASKQKDLKKIVNENKGLFKGASSPSETSLGGQKAMMMSYTPAGKVKGKVWFVVKGDKLFRITTNWFTGEEKDFLPVFDKSVATIKFM